MAPTPHARRAANELLHQRARFLTVALSTAVVLLALQAVASPLPPVRTTGAIAAAAFALLLLLWRTGLISQRVAGALAGAAATALLLVRMVSVLSMLESSGPDARVAAVGLAVQTFVIPALLAGVVLATGRMLVVHAGVALVVTTLALLIPPPGTWSGQATSVGAVVQMLTLMALTSAMIHVLNASTLSMEASEEQARTAAETDPLTGLANRRSLERALRSLQDGAAAGGVLMVDLDHFKAINDTLGHETGDDVLVAVATTLQHVIRPDDTVGRWGGEEFLIVLPDADGDVLIEVAERIRGAVEQLPDGPPGGITVSVGAALRRSTDDVDALVSRADRAMYVAKAGGRNCVASADLLPGDEPRIV